MKCTVTLEFRADDGVAFKQLELMNIHRPDCIENAGDVGLTLADGKKLLECIQQEFVNAQVTQHCAVHQRCIVCSRVRKLHDEHCVNLSTVYGSAIYIRPRWKACACGADHTKYLSPLKNALSHLSLPELQWLHAKLGGLLPYRQASAVMDLLLPTGGRHNHVTVRNHTIAVSKSIEHQTLSPNRSRPTNQSVAELGIDVGYIRRVRGTGSDAIAVVAAAVGSLGNAPRVWASTNPRTKFLHKEMTEFLKASGVTEDKPIHVLTDGAKDLAAVTKVLPHKTRWVLDWAHIGRMFKIVDRTLTPLARGVITKNGSPVELWDLFVRFRSAVWTGNSSWEKLGDKLYRLLFKRDKLRIDRWSTSKVRYSLLRLLSYLEHHKDVLIDYRQWKIKGRRISTSFVESTINRLIGRRMCKGQQMCWSPKGAHALLQVRAALLNGEFDQRAQATAWWIGRRRVSFSELHLSHPF
jgi:hypothetical protein